MAADSLPRFEVSGGYSYLHMPSPSGATINHSPEPWNGWDASLAINLNRWLGLETDFAGHYSSSQLNIATPAFVIPFAPGTLPALPAIHPPSLSSSLHTFLAGPQFAYRMPHGKIFAHGLIGGALARGHFPGFSVSVPGVLPSPLITVPAFSSTNHAFAWRLGGGGDWMFTRTLGWRVAQVDYLGTRFGPRTQNQFTVSTGLLWNFGR
jgi:hypothetical protein